MKLRNIFTFCVCTFAFAGSLTHVQAQHFDVEFGYFNGEIEFETEGPGIDALGIFETEFEFENMDGSQVAEDPGFASNFVEGDETFSVTSGDNIFINVNQSSTLGSYLTFFNTTSGAFESTNATITVEDNSPAGTSDLVVTESGLSGDLSQFLVTSDGTEIDTHVDYILSAGAQDGVYGLLLNLESDNLSGDLTQTDSGQFWVLFNNGLSERAFETAVGNFSTSSIPEPSSFIVLAALSTGLLRRKR